MKLEARIDRMVQKGNVKAIASVSMDGMFVVKGLKVIDGRKGLFVSMTQESYPGKNGQKQYSNTFFALTNSAKMQLQEAVLDAYKQIPITHRSRIRIPRIAGIRRTAMVDSTNSSTRNRDSRIICLMHRNTLNSLVVLMICFPWTLIRYADFSL